MTELRKKWFIPILLLFIMFLPEKAFAHKIVVEQVEESLFLVRYDDGTRAGNATVFAYNKDGDLLSTERTDKDGYVSIDVEATRVVADDGLGHRTAWTEIDNENESTVPLWMRAMLGLAILSLVASYFVYKNQQRNK